METKSKILTVNNTSMRTQATASDEKYNYKVDYQVSGNHELELVNITVSDKAGAYAGTLNFNGTSRNVSTPETTDVMIVNEMFDAIVSEIKEELKE